MRLRHVVASELTKVVSTRSTRWTVGAMFATAPVLAVIVAATGSLQPDDTVLGASLTGAVLSQVLAGVFGALVLTSEYRTGSIAPTLTAVPHRARLFTAKAVVTAVVIAATSLPSVTVAHLLGRAMLDDEGYAPGEPWPALFGVAASITLVALLGLVAAALLRHTAGTVLVVVGVLLVPSMFGPLLGRYQRWLGGASPTGVLEKLTQTSDASPETVGSLGGFASLGIAAALAVAVGLVAGLWFERRDA